jgi:nucleotide-binding universal stress UspA family protein
MSQPKSIVVGVDFEEPSERALETALETAADSAGAEVHVAYVLQIPVDPLNPYAAPPPPELEADVARVQAMVQKKIQELIAKRRVLEIKQVSVHGAIGAPAKEIADLAARVSADLVVVGSHGRRGLDRAFLGSVAEKVVRLAGCPTLVVRPKRHPSIAKEPEVEALCPECAQRRYETKGAELWCARHAEHHPRAHVYSYEEISSDPARPWGFH